MSAATAATGRETPRVQESIRRSNCDRTHAQCRGELAYRREPLAPQRACVDGLLDRCRDFCRVRPSDSCLYQF
jgi:hypothetical protein